MVLVLLVAWLNPLQSQEQALITAGCEPQTNNFLTNKSHKDTMSLFLCFVLVSLTELDSFERLNFPSHITKNHRIEFYSGHLEINLFVKL